MSVRNIGIFAHVDAGKTTLSEQLLVHAGKLRQAGSVDKGTTYTDDLPVEKRRGISVRASCVKLTWRGTDINLIDTPGHSDFSAEIERSFWALDAAILVVDAAQGMQPQTETLLNAFKQQNLPYMVFINKTDRPNADVLKTLARLKKRMDGAPAPLWDEEALAESVCAHDDDMLSRYLEGDMPGADEMRPMIRKLTEKGLLHPVLAGSALRDVGVGELLDAITDYLPGPRAVSGQLCAVAFAAHEDKLMGRGLWVRVFGGALENRMAVDILAGRDKISGEDIYVQRKITQIRDAGSCDTGILRAGDVGVVYGLGDVNIGYVFGDAQLLPRKVRPGLLKTPLITVQLVPEDSGKLTALSQACQTLSKEDPLLEAAFERSTGEVHINVMGKIQLEILGEILETRFGIKTRFLSPTVIYRETIEKRATGFVAYTMPKPCWAIIEFDIKPAPRGSGVKFTSLVQDRDIMMRYQHQIYQALPKALSQGRLGWQVTDVEITLTGGNHHLIHTHPLDFIVATPMAIQDGLKRGGSVLLEPILEMRMVLPQENIGRVISDVNLMRGEVISTQSDDEAAILTARVPVATSMDYPSEFASLTSGRGSMSASLYGYRECPIELGSTRARRGVDPLDTAKYILAARSALEGDIYD